MESFTLIMLALVAVTCCRAEDISFKIPNEQCKALKDELNVGSTTAPEFPPIVTLYDLDEFSNEITDLKIKGLRTMKLEFLLKEADASINLALSFAHLEAESSYNASGNINVLPMRVPASGDFTGAGKATMNAHNLAIKASATLTKTAEDNPKIQVDTLTISEFKFDQLHMNLENCKLNGTDVNWDEVNKNSKEKWDAEFAVNGNDFVEEIRKAINVMLSNSSSKKVLDQFKTFAEAPDFCEADSGATFVKISSGFLFSLLGLALSALYY